MIGKLLRRNFTIQILDISNNLIGDRGLEHLAKGLCQQASVLANGLSALIVFNNQISEKSGKIINSIIVLEFRNIKDGTFLPYVIGVTFFCFRPTVKICER